MLEEQNAEVAEERNSRKHPLADDEVRNLIAETETVLIARSKKAREVPSAEVGLDELKGPTGNYRAPMVRVGNRLLVGFHPDTLRELVAP